MSFLLLNEQSGTPSTPAGGKVTVYSDNTDSPNLKMVDDLGNVITQLANSNTVAQIGNKDFHDTTTTISRYTRD